MRFDNFAAWGVALVSVAQYFGLGDNPPATSAHVGMAVGVVLIVLLRIEQRKVSA